MASKQVTNNELKKAIEEIKLILTGNGDPQKGLVVRVDRLEQRSKLLGYISGSILGGLIAWLVGVFKVH